MSGGKQHHHPDETAGVTIEAGGAARPRDMTDSFQPTDWRDLSLALHPGAKPRPDRPAPGAPRLHLHARPSTLREEIARAREVISAAKVAVETTFADIRFGRNIDIGQLAPIVGGIAASMSRNPLAIPSLTRLKERHEYTYLHSVAVCGLMIGLARQLGLDTALDHDIGLAGLLHDIGKARVPMLLLDKPGPLTVDEFAVVRAHTERGRDLLAKAGGMPDIALDVCLNHHERMDGTGYPYGRSGERLSIYARMAAICDVYDAVTSARAYKNSWSPGEAREWMAGATGHFDRSILTAFSQMLGAFPIGALVRLQSDRLAVVLDDAAADPISPSVCVFHCATTRRPLPWRRCTSKLDPIVGVERPESWDFPEWNSLRAEILGHFVEGR